MVEVNCLRRMKDEKRKNPVKKKSCPAGEKGSSTSQLSRPYKRGCKIFEDYKNQKKIR